MMISLGKHFKAYDHAFFKQKIGSFRQPTHKRGVHREIFSMISTYFKIRILGKI